MLRLPKDFREFAYDRIAPFGWNVFDLDMILPLLFFRVVTGGQDRGRMPRDPSEIRERVDQLAHHPSVAGFDGVENTRLLDRLVRTALVQVGGTGQARREEQINGLISYTLLAFKPGLPKEIARLRRIDLLLYHMLRDELGGDAPLRAFFEGIFGRGVNVWAGAEPGGSYDGHTDLDTLTRLSVCLIDCFEGVGARPSRERPPAEAMPVVAGRMARDLRRFLQSYQRRMPVEALAYHFKALIYFELLVYMLKLFKAVPALVGDSHELPAAMRTSFLPSPPEIYVDFSGSTTGLSRAIAAACVRRDIESINSFIAASLTLRQLDRYVEGFRRDRRLDHVVSQSLPTNDLGPEYLRSLLRLAAEDRITLRIGAAAQRDEEIIRAANKQGNDGEEDLADKEIDRIAAPAESDFERLILLLVNGQKSTSSDVLKCYRSAGGLLTSFGILRGTSANRQSWRYAPSNDLLATLVQLATVDLGAEGEGGEVQPTSVGLREFLGWLERRFGVLVDRPPAGFEGADYVAAAQENLQAMLRRLRQMGVFRDLSDDLTVQRLQPPYVA